ncbi:LOW QUALITY PROTEIN: DENN domain-containing protein 5B-like [Boleophthalmus pectinirostris]|uniref:LOW QUALITY PROTEIN: DENN domain-containing protein 5B-like n=1 Tax=Boleophthalmus pectinirostris TaxID=150288 RepID=UPI00242EBC6D|nr:LOW QUALITY PROTEIN: DENN domain-containing protein 5B-like [Boleophthalmus pectinirostris]
MSGWSAAQCRFVHYFAVCGLDPQSGLEPDRLAALCRYLESERSGESCPENHTEPGLEHTTFRSKVLARFPENVDGNPFDQDAVSMLCIPDGLSFHTRPLPPRFHSFLITREDFSRTYGFVLTFYERVSVAVETLLHLRHPTHQTRNSPSSPSSSSSMDSLSSGGGGADPCPSEGVRSERSCGALFVPKALCIIAPLPFMGACRSFLWQLHRAVMSETPPPLPLESYVYNLLYEVPLPAPGRSLRFQGVYEPIVCQRPGPAELPLADFPLSDVIALLGLDNLVQVFTCTLLEMQVLLYSHDPQRVVSACECLSSLLFPFQWQHVYVPLLPSSLRHFLDAPVPYLMGLQGRGDGDRTCLDLPQEANLCFVDLDRRSVDLPEDFPQFPLKSDLIQDLLDVLQSSASSGPESSSCPGSPRPASSPCTPAAPRRNSLEALDRRNGNLPPDRPQPRRNAAVLELLQNNETLERLEALTRRTGVSVARVDALRAGVKGQSTEREGRRPSSRLEEEKRAAVLNAQLREVFADHFTSMFCDYETFVVQSGSDLHTWLTARENMHNFDKASFLSEQPEFFLPFLSRFIETQMFASFIDQKIMSQWEQKEALLRVFDQRVHEKKRHQLRAPNLTSTHGSAHSARRTTLCDAARAVEQRFQNIDHTAVLPHLLNMKIGEGRFEPGHFPDLKRDALNSAPNRWSHRGPAPPAAPHRQTQTPGKTEQRLDNEQKELQESRALGKSSLRQPKLSDVSPAVIAQTNWKFVEGLLKECRLKTKRLLVAKMGGEAVELGHGEALISGLEENTLVASLCDLLERIWSHGLLVKQGKSSLWSHLLHYQAREERLEQQAQNTQGDEERRRRRSDCSLQNSARVSLLQDMRHVQLMSEIKTDVGRARAWIRLSLEKKTLSQHLRQLLSRAGLTKKLYKRYAFLRCEDEREQFLFHLLSLNAVDYFCFTNVYTTIMISYRVAIVPVKKFSNSLLTSNPWVCVSGELRDSGVRAIPKNLLEMGFDCQNLGRLTTLQIGHDNAGLLAKWLLDCVLVRNEVTGHTYRFPCGRWLGKGVDDGSLERVLIGELLPPGGGAEEEAGRGSATPPQQSSPSQTRRISLSSITAKGIKPTSGQIQDAVGEVVNNMIKHFHKPEKERGSLTVLLCGDNSLVTALEQLFAHGFKSSRLFQKNIFVWDFVEKACAHLASAQRAEDLRDLGDHGDHGDQDRSFARYVQAINSSSRSIGKDGKFQLLVCLGTRDRVLAQWLPLLSSCPVTAQYYEDWALLRDSAAVESLSQVLLTLHHFPLTLEASLVKGIRL